ncbi:hypothetical protein [Actinomadura macrotermitis]|uniref:Uncharacterized protein n=1 Tax=Actinomadura macrotermitis TaxID=2585200 RepID=A0A7K0BS06_9ACTN|nr:hypothetical protein [Actinomadura macrotermitis]MQY03985.1 hypothetical protein [Actinomadura macrotermitis]
MSEPRSDEERRDAEGRYEEELGDDEQVWEIEEAEKYVEDPPDNLIIREPKDGPIGIAEYMRAETRTGDPAPDDRPAEEDAVTVRERGERRLD